MAPRIRGIKPEFRKYTSPSVVADSHAVKKSSGKQKVVITPEQMSIGKINQKIYKSQNGVFISPQKNSKGRSKATPKKSAKTIGAGTSSNSGISNTSRLEKGDPVEVRLDEDGLYGSWHQAVICAVKRGLRQVKFKNLLDDNNKPVREWLPFGNESLGMELPPGTRKRTDRPVIRPGGLGLPPVEPSFRRTGGWPKDLWVEVFAQDAWWEGVLAQGISATQMDEETSIVDVNFPQLGDLIEEVQLRNLRECKDWNEITGAWTIRGRRTEGGALFGHQQMVDTGKSTANGNAKIRSVESDADMKDEEGVIIDLAQDLQQSIIPVTVEESSIPFGRLTEVSEEKDHFLLKVHAAGYAMKQIAVLVQDDNTLHLSVNSITTNKKFGSVTCKTGSVLNCWLGLPSDIPFDLENISWEIRDAVLAVTVPLAAPGPVADDDINSPLRQCVLDVLQGVKPLDVRMSDVVPAKSC